MQHAIRIRDEIRSINPECSFIIVTKTQSVDVIKDLLGAGFRDFGENRVEQFVEREALLPEARWHFIGHLARKNAAKVVGRAELIHSVDSVRLLEKIERSCKALECVDVVGDEAGVIQRVLLQVNTSGEWVKQGFDSDGLREFSRKFDAAAYPHVKVEGLMTMAPFVSDEGVLRHCFSRLRKLRDEIIAEYGVEWKELSMGMSNDYRIALEEGATMVRIGTAIFGHDH